MTTWTSDAVAGAAVILTLAKVSTFEIRKTKCQMQMRPRMP
jgi:hypothetical protein